MIILLVGCSNSEQNSEVKFEEKTTSNTANVYDTEKDTEAEDIQIQGDVSETGKCGDNLTWSLTDDGTLYIIGTGQMDEIEWGTTWQNNFTTKKRPFMVKFLIMFFCFLNLHNR